MWQITSYVGLAFIALALVWLPGPPALERFYLAWAFAGIVCGAFFVTLFGMPLYGGRAYDDNGYAPFAVAGLKFDANVSVFSVMTTLFIASGALVAMN